MLYVPWYAMAVRCNAMPIAMLYNVMPCRDLMFVLDAEHCLNFVLKHLKSPLNKKSDSGCFLYICYAIQSA